MKVSNITTGNRIFDAVFERSLDFQIELEFEAARQFIERIYQYNDFQAHLVLEALYAIDTIIPRFECGRDNPNNGKRDFKISVGREGSPVIYIKRYEFNERQPLTEEQMKSVCTTMRKTGIADEADYEIDEFGSGRKITFRFWWD